MKVSPPIPILRIFDEAKAREFYLDFLSFEVVFEHRFEPTAPLYMGVRLDACELHLSEHHGDGAPGVAIRIEVDDVAACSDALLAKDYKYNRPGVIDQTWGQREMPIPDPFGNRLIFCTAI
ncbi:MAG: glyoxalase superfamily protein [Pseudomonadota bacterium]